MTRWRLRVLVGGIVAVSVAVAAAVMVARGDADEAEPRVASPLADCAALTTPPGGGPPGEEVAGDGARQGVAQLPEGMTRPCFTGGEQVTVSGLAGPAVVNFWASWCPPCRQELPVLQRLADRAAGDVHVVGVVTDDTREGAASFADDVGVTFPSLSDADRELFHAMGLSGMPSTLFVDADGAVRHIQVGPPYDDAELAALVAEHLGVDVPAGSVPARDVPSEEGGGG